MSRTVYIQDIQIPGALCPPDIRDWLQRMGWMPMSTNGTESWTRHDTNDAHHDLMWEQAMAVEFYKFVSLGGHIRGQTPT